jgi:arginase family enzyme
VSDLNHTHIISKQRHPILHIDAKEMMQASVGERVQAALQIRAGEANAWYLHIDLGVGEPEQSPGGFIPAPYWPPSEHILEAARATVQTLPVKVASLAVYNPAADTDGRGVRFGLDMAMALIR